MRFLKDCTSKRLTLALILSSMALINLLALVFTIARGRVDLLTEAEIHYVNGFLFAFGEAPMFVEENAIWMTFYCNLHFILSLLIIAGLVAYVLIKRKLCLGALATATVIVSSVMQIAFLISAAFAYGTAAGYLDYGYVCTTAMFVPIILHALLVVGYYTVKIKMPENYTYSKKQK